MADIWAQINVHASFAKALPDLDSKAGRKFIEVNHGKEKGPEE